MASRNIQGEAAATRVVVIETLYLETDAHNFKSVVQSLTGKDAGVDVKQQEVSSSLHHQRGGDIIDKKRRRRSTHASPPPPRHSAAPVVVSTCEMSSSGGNRALSSSSSFKDDSTQGLWFPDLPQQMEELPSWLWDDELRFL